MTIPFHSSHRRRAAALAATVAIAAVGLGACGGGPDKSETANPPKLPPVSDSGRTDSDRIVDEHLQDTIEQTHDDQMDAIDGWSTDPYTP